MLKSQRLRTAGMPGSLVMGTAPTPDFCSHEMTVTIPIMAPSSNWGSTSVTGSTVPNGLIPGFTPGQATPNGVLLIPFTPRNPQLDGLRDALAHWSKYKIGRFCIKIVMNNPNGVGQVTVYTHLDPEKPMPTVDNWMASGESFTTNAATDVSKCLRTLDGWKSVGTGVTTQQPDDEIDSFILGIAVTGTGSTTGQIGTAFVRFQLEARNWQIGDTMDGSSGSGGGSGTKGNNSYVQSGLLNETNIYAIEDKSSAPGKNLKKQQIKTRGKQTPKRLSAYRHYVESLRDENDDPVQYLVTNTPAFAISASDWGTALSDSLNDPDTPFFTVEPYISGLAQEAIIGSEGNTNLFWSSNVDIPGIEPSTSPIYSLIVSPASQYNGNLAITEWDSSIIPASKGVAARVSRPMESEDLKLGESYNDGYIVANDVFRNSLFGVTGNGTVGFDTVGGAGSGFITYATELQANFGYCVGCNDKQGMYNTQWGFTPGDGYQTPETYANLQLKASGGRNLLASAFNAKCASGMRSGRSNGGLGINWGKIGQVASNIFNVASNVLSSITGASSNVTVTSNGEIQVGAGEEFVFPTFTYPNIPDTMKSVATSYSTANNRWGKGMIANGYYEAWNSNNEVPATNISFDIKATLNTAQVLYEFTNVGNIRDVLNQTIYNTSGNPTGIFHPFLTNQGVSNLRVNMTVLHSNRPFADRSDVEHALSLFEWGSWQEDSRVNLEAYLLQPSQQAVAQTSISFQSLTNPATPGWGEASTAEEYVAYLESLVQHVINVSMNAKGIPFPKSYYDKDRQALVDYQPGDPIFFFALFHFDQTFEWASGMYRTEGDTVYMPIIGSIGDDTKVRPNSFVGIYPAAGKTIASYTESSRQEYIHSGNMALPVNGGTGALSIDNKDNYPTAVEQPSMQHNSSVFGQADPSEAIPMAAAPIESDFYPLSLHETQEEMRTIIPSQGQEQPDPIPE